MQRSQPAVEAHRLTRVKMLTLMFPVQPRHPAAIGLPVSNAAMPDWAFDKPRSASQVLANAGPRIG